MKLKLEFEREERRLAREEASGEAQRACNAEQALQDAQLAAQLAEAEKAGELRLAELKRLANCVN